MLKSMIPAIGRRGALLLAFACLSPCLTAAGDPVLLTVIVPGRPALTLTAAELAKMPRATGTVQRDGETSTYEGVLVWDILHKAYGLAPEKNLPVNAKLSYIVGTARDGYQAMFALGEMAPVFAGFRVMVADKRNGGPLAAYQRPLQMVAPQDKAQGRAMFSLMKLELFELPGARKSSPATR